jgi:hypothetical protein
VLMDGAFVIDLIRAATIPILDFGFWIFDLLCGKVDNLRRGDVKTVAVSVEITAIAAGIAKVLNFEFWVLSLFLDPAIDIRNGIDYILIF